VETAQKIRSSLTAGDQLLPKSCFGVVKFTISSSFAESHYVSWQTCAGLKLVMSNSCLWWYALITCLFDCT